jgi:hypothetical protein
MVNEHLTFPPLPNNTNGNFPSWNGLGGQFDPLWFNSQGYSFHSYGKTVSSDAAIPLRIRARRNLNAFFAHRSAGTPAAGIREHQPGALRKQRELSRAAC